MNEILFLGPEGTFAHAATDLLRGAGTDATFRACATVQEIVHHVEDGDVSMGLVPIENSIEGGVTSTIDVLVFETENVVIREEVAVPVSFQALRRPGDDSEITAALSHPVGLAQTTKWWGSRGLECRTTTSTGEAARIVAASTEPGLVAIASMKAGQLAGLEIIASDIEDHSGAETRFALIGRKLAVRSGNDRTTWVVTPSTSEESGVLLRILQPIAERGINLSNIMSRPLRQGLGVYCFLLTLDGHGDDEPVRDALEVILAMGCEVKNLGSYPAWRS